MMKNETRTSHIKDVDIQRNEIKARKPFRIQREEKRRFVRLEISSPMWLKKLKDIFGNFWPDRGGPVIDGTILNISAGGVLVELCEPVNEGDIVSICFTLQGAETMDSVLGLIKRSEPDDGACLVGIEFVDRSRLSDILSRSELELLSQEFTGFEKSVEGVLKRYLYTGSSINS